MSGAEERAARGEARQAPNEHANRRSGMNIGETDELSAWHARKLIRWCLAESESMELAGLVKQTAMDERLIRREIMRLMSE